MANAPSSSAAKPPGFGLGGLFAGLATFVLVWQVFTQIAAHRLEYQPALTGPFTPSMGDMLYAPWSLIVWFYRFPHIPEVVAMLEPMLLTTLTLSMLGTLTVVVLVGVLTRKLGKNASHTGFSSEWADDIDVEFSGFRVADAWLPAKQVKAAREELYRENNWK